MRLFKYYFLPLLIALTAKILFETLIDHHYDKVVYKILFIGLFIYYFYLDSNFNKFRLPISISFAIFSSTELLIYYSSIGPAWIKLATSLTALTTLILYGIRYASKKHKTKTELLKLFGFTQYLLVIPYVYLTDIMKYAWAIGVSTIVLAITYIYTRVILNDKL